MRAQTAGASTAIIKEEVQDEIISRTVIEQP